MMICNEMTGIYVILSQSRPRKTQNDNSRVTTRFPKELLDKNIAQRVPNEEMKRNFVAHIC